MLLALLKGDFYKNQKAHVLFFCSDSDRGLIIEKKRFAQIIDSYGKMNHSNETSLTIAPWGSFFVGDRAWGRVVIPSFFSGLAIIFLRLLGRFFAKFANFSEFKELLVYEKIIKATQCKSIISINPPSPLIIAAKNCNVEIYDIQHGDIAVGVPFYDRASRLHDNLKFLVWDSRTAELLVDSLQIDPMTISIVGHPLLSFSGRKLNEFSDQRKNISRLVDREDYSEVLLVTLQWGLSETFPKYFSNSVIPDAVISAIDSSQDRLWVLRLHPIMSSNKKELQHIKQLVRTRSNVIIMWPHDFIVPLALQHCDLHITWHSSSVIEAVLLGVPSLVLCPKPYIYSGYKSDNELTDKVTLPYENYRTTGLVFWAHELEDNQFNAINFFIENNGRKPNV